MNSATVRLFTVCDCQTLAEVLEAIRDGADLNADPGGPVTGLTPLGFAIGFPRSLDVLTALVEAGANVNGLDGEHDEFPILLAVMRPCREEWSCLGVKFLLDHGADVNKRSKEGFSALLSAAYRGYSSVVELLLERGADHRFEACVHGGTNTKYNALAFARKRLASARSKREQQGYEDTIRLLEKLEAAS